MKILKSIAVIVLALMATTASAQKQKQASSTSFLQKNQRCGTQAVLDEAIRKNPSLRLQIEENRKQTLQRFNQIKTTLRPNAIYTIPVVVHVVLSQPSSVTDAQIQAQLDVLNADYAGLNADSTRIPAAFKSRFGKGNIRFCLAKRDPRGDATSGILRVTSSVLSAPGNGDPVKFTCLGGSDAWDATKYLNIWVCQMPTGFLGYSFFASDPLDEHPLNERGFVNSFRAFGKGGSAVAPFNLGRTATHEIGHFFDLNHIWGPNNCDGTQNCTDDDGVGDTPPQFKCNFGAPRADSVIVDACSTSAPGIMWMNYMDYVDDLAMVMYTPGQYARMEAILLANPWMMNLITSDGCTPMPVNARDVRFERFRDAFYDLCGSSPNYIYTCSSSYRPFITVKNTGTDVINSLTLSARFGTGPVTTTTWTGSIAPQSTANILLNNMPLSNGVNSNLIVYSSNPNGSADQKVANDTGKLTGIVLPFVNLPYNEGFENASFPPVLWQRINTDNSITWERTTRAAKTGTASMYINNFDYNSNGNNDWMYSPLMPVRGKDSAFLSFRVAAATFNAPDLANNPVDTLEILVTDDCGLSYRSVYKKWGKDLVTTGNIAVDTGYVPSPSQWRLDSAFLGDYSAGSSDYMQVVFRNTTNYENNIYVDDINVYTKDVNPNLKRKGVMATPNPFRNIVVLQHYPTPLNIEFINVYDLMGRLVWQKRISLNRSGNNFGPSYLELDLGTLGSGVYTIQVVYRGAPNVSLKVIKVN
jgi:Pregnancy-associated plasma protein-A